MGLSSFLSGWGKKIWKKMKKVKFFEIFFSTFFLVKSGQNWLESAKKVSFSEKKLCWANRVPIGGQPAGLSSFLAGGRAKK